MTEVLIGSSPVALLVQEHRILEQQIGELETSLEKRGLGWAMFGQATPAQLRALVIRFRDHLMAHFRHEEGGFYCRVRRALREKGQQEGLLHEFFASEGRYDLAAHQVLTEQTAAMVSLLDEFDGGTRRRGQAQGRLFALAKQVRHVLERHAAAEEKWVFPMAEEVLRSADAR